MVGKFNVFARLLYLVPKLKEKIDQRKQLKEKIDEQEENKGGLTEEEKKELSEQWIKLVNLNKIPHIQVFDEIQRFSEQWDEVQKQTTQESIKFEIYFDTESTIKQCQDLINLNLSFTPGNNSYSDFILEVMLPIIHQLAFTGIEHTNPELITKIISGQYDNIIDQRIDKISNYTSQHQQSLSLLTLNNLLDEVLVKVYNVAKLFIGLEEHPLTDWQIKQMEEILSELKLTRKFINETLAQKIFKQIKNRQIFFTLSDKEKEGLTEE